MPRQNSRERYPPTSDSEDDDEWEERMRTAGEAHGRERRTERESKAGERAYSQATQGRRGSDRRNSYEQPPSYEDSKDEEDDEWVRDSREQWGRTNRQREAGDRAYTRATEKEQREWLREVQARLEVFLQLRKKIERMKANIEDMHQKDAEILESEQRRRSRRAYRTLRWDHITEKEETEQARNRVERLQARTAAMIKLTWAEKNLEQSENDYETFLSLQSRQRREQADRMEAALKADTEHTAQQEAKANRAREEGMSERLARDAQYRRKETEGRRREVDEEPEERETQREEARKAKSRETQKDEAARRQRLLEKIEKQKQETRSPYPSDPNLNDNRPKPSHVHTPESVFAAKTEETRSKTPPQSPNYQPYFRTRSPDPAYNPSPSEWRDGELSYASDSSEVEGYCDHGDFWPKIKGGIECSHCARFCNAFIFQCPACGILACVSCRDRLRRGGL